MALRNAWWMKAQPVIQSQTQPSPSQPGSPHLTWPGKQADHGLSFAILEKTLRDKPGRSCNVACYTYALPTTAAVASSASGRVRPRSWTLHKAVTSVDALLEVLEESVRAPSTPLLGLTNLVAKVVDPVHSVVYVATLLQSESIQALGHHLELSPRFFNFPYTRISTGNLVERYFFFTLQFMDRYQIGCKPSEAGRLATSPTYRFRNANGDYHPHEWHITCVRLIFLKDENNYNFQGLIQIDPLDDAIADGLKTLMTRYEEQPPGEAESHAGLGQILSEVIYIVAYNWTAFFMEAEEHLQVLSKKCVDEDLTGDEQLRYTRELHQLSPLWVQVRRRLIAAKDLAAQMIEHPFFAIIGGFNGRIAIESYLNKQIKIVDDQITTCKEIADQTNVLISLIFNIATLQDTRAAVEESKAANAFAASIRRVTMLTFVYLPLTLASSILGMNVSQITGESTHSTLWTYFVTAIALMIMTFGGWYIWSRLLIRMETRARLRAQSKMPRPAV
ncbi:hypothetical protein NX059_006357 [Plenodomus lindquistii]|nr:hypothetical protein NX059_006357 [Plenodomus lindquistii]